MGDAIWGREESSVCDKATKGIAGKRTGTGAQRYMGYASERHSIGGKRMENQRGDSNVCGVWGV